jgi:hypothetical protein
VAINIFVVGDKAAERMPREIMKQLRSQQGRLVTQAGRIARDRTRAKIIAGNFEEPSKWIKAKKNARKALVGVAQKVGIIRKSRSQVIIDTRDPRYSLAQHHEGYTLPADGQTYTLDLKRPTALDPPHRNPFRFKWVKASVVPARDILPTEEELQPEIDRAGKKFLRDVIVKAKVKI